MKLLFEHADILMKEDGELCVWKDAYLGVEDERICRLSKTAPADARDYSRRNFQTNCSSRASSTAIATAP